MKRKSNNTGTQTASTDHTIQSMTGFANKTFVLTSPAYEKTNVAISLKSLNYRFFEATMKLPYPLAHLESELIKFCKNKLIRGHVYLTIHMSNPNVFRGSVEPALASLEGYLNAIERIKKLCNITQTINLDHILRLPNIFSIEELGVDHASEQLILDTINELLDLVVEAREKEGTELLHDIEERIVIMQQEITAIEQVSDRLIKEQKNKIKTAMQELTNDTSTLAQTRKDTLYALLDKLDIHEEIIRFTTHLENLQAQLHTANIEKGKRLDFTLQELAREINTITAKCSDIAISTRAINVKIEIEKAREQVQNIV
jgi:uncharacterized protein (TIGR00255 family)